MEPSLWALFFSAFIAATILPSASEVVLWAMVADNPALLWPGIAAASLGNTLGAVVNWLLGRYLSNFAGRKWYPLSPARQDRAIARAAEIANELALHDAIFFGNACDRRARHNHALRGEPVEVRGVQMRVAVAA